MKTTLAAVKFDNAKGGIINSKNISSISFYGSYAKVYFVDYIRDNLGALYRNTNYPRTIFNSSAQSKLLTAPDTIFGGNSDILGTTTTYNLLRIYTPGNYLYSSTADLKMDLVITDRYADNILAFNNFLEFDLETLSVISASSIFDSFIYDTATDTLTAYTNTDFDTLNEFPIYTIDEGKVNNGHSISNFTIFSDRIEIQFRKLVLPFGNMDRTSCRFKFYGQTND